MRNIFDRQSFYKLNNQEMFDKLLDVSLELGLLDIKKEDIEDLVFSIQLGKSGINFYEVLTAINKKREKEFLDRINDKDLMFKELVKHEKELWVRAFNTNLEEAKAFQDYYFQSIDDTIKICKEKGIEPSYDYLKLKRVYLVFKKEYFKTHTIKEKCEDDKAN